jgi:uncharacterized protein (TIGR03084 family)
MVQEVLDALSEQHAETAALLGGLAADDWERPTRCTGWTVADVVLHMAQTDEMATASLNAELDRFLAERTGGRPASSVDDGAALMVERERGRPGPEIGARWSASATALRSLLAAHDPHARVQWVAGTLSAHTLAATRLAECWIHTGDVAEGVGTPLAPTSRLRLVARLAWRTLPYAFAREGRALTGPVAFDLTGPAGEPWSFVPDEPAVTVVRGSGVELCQVAARRKAPESLEATGPDGALVLELVRTYA